MTAIQAPTSTTFRDLAFTLSPTYLKGFWGQRWIYTQAIILDAMADGSLYAVYEGLPSLCSSDALPWLQLDRQIDRGPNEAETSFRLRLRQWLDLWRHAGTQRGLLLALASYLSPVQTTIETVNESVLSANVTAWDSSTNGADPPTHFQESPANWFWDSLNIPGRSWVIIFNGPWAQGPTWGSFFWGDGTVFGMLGGSPPNDGSSIRSLVKKWKSAGDFVQQVIVAFDAAWYQPSLTYPDAHLPDGTWGPWGKTATKTESYGLWGLPASTSGLQQGAWGSVSMAQVPGVQGPPVFARTYVPKAVRTTNSAGTVANSYIPNLPVFRVITTATNARSYVPTRPVTSCFLGPVL